METPTADDLPGIIDLVASWQTEGQPVQVHPGDLGWYQRFGADALASALRLWVRNGETVAVGFLDESELIRLALSPACGDDSTLAEAGWTSDAPWTTLHRDLSDTLPPPLTLRIETVGPDHIDDRLRVESAAFPGSSLTRQRWAQMAGGHAYRRASCLVGYTETGEAAGAVTVWSAGRGRPGIVEPLGVHSDHRGHRFGVDMTLAAASALEELGASSVTVATPSSNTAAVATYRAAGMDILGEVTDFVRPGP